MPNIIAWRESNRKAASEYAELPVGVARSDYSIDFDQVQKRVVDEGLTRFVAHLYNNEAISACIRMKDKESKDGNADFDPVQYLHDYRMAVRGKILDGSFGASRGVGVSVTTDPVTAKMQLIFHERLVVIAMQKGREDFPKVFDANTAKIVIFPKSGKTLGQLVSEMIASDDGKVRAKATAEVEREKAEREARLAEAAATPVEDDAESLWEDEAAE
jgi:hypothetical protein